MKKWISLVLCVVLIGTLAACGGQPTAQPEPAANEETGSDATPVNLSSGTSSESAAEADGVMPFNQLTEWQQGNGFDPETTAILVIDDYGGDWYGDETPEQPFLNAFDIVKAGREAGLPVIFVDDAHLAGIDHELELWGEHGLAGDPTSLPLTGFDIQESDYLIEKRRYDGFFQTDLDITLRELGVDTLIAFGTDTNICVLQTLSTAYYLGYNIIVPEDACTNELGVGTHEGAIDYFVRCYGARIVSTETIIDEIKAVI